MKLYKEGKLFNIATARLIATSEWYMHYGYKRHRVYKSVNGTFFRVEETTTLEDIRQVIGNVLITTKNGIDVDVTPNSVIIDNILSLERAMNMFDHILSGKGYATNYTKFNYKLHVAYEDIFDVTAG
jgi:hypothetical protein